MTALAFFGLFFLVVAAVALHDWAAATGTPTGAGDRRTSLDRWSAGDVGPTERRMTTRQPQVDRLDVQPESVDVRTAMAGR